ncbi:MAG: endonuclease NucS [Candidatus Diapherotrites archaeon]|nr:endonuclease NucS [Candidatus Diapherotrites archaeon]
MELAEAKQVIERALHEKKMLLIVGACKAEYWGRAASKLPQGKRLLVCKGDGSFALHQNKLLRPTNYMMNATYSLNHDPSKSELVLEARKTNPKETIKVYFESIEHVYASDMDLGKSDLRLFGTEKELSDQLMQGLDFIEPGLRPVKQENPLRTGMIDILAEDAQGRLVVIEVKRRLADYDAVTQLRRYMEVVKKLKGKETRGILIAPEIRSTAKDLLEREGLEFYKIDFEIGNPRAKIKGLEKKQKTLFES